MRTPRDPIYAGHRYPAEIISYAVWLYFRFPLSLRMVEEILAARGISVTHETIRQWGLKFGQEFANRIRRRAPRRGDKWHLDEVVIAIAGKKHWLWRAVDQEGFVLDVLVQRRRDKKGDCLEIGGIRRHLLLAGADRWRGRISVRSRNRTCHCRRRSEPAAADRRPVATSASAGTCSSDGSPGSWPSLR